MTREDRIKELISQMTLEEKVTQLSYTSPAIERLGIPEYNWWSEALHGSARSGTATIFPQSIAMAATFDPDLVHSTAEAISDEVRAKYNAASRRGNRRQYWGLTCWSPNINIFRDPRWGRGQETYGEDPFLMGEMGTAFVKGLQGDDPENLKVAACAKHFAVHSGPEKDRHTFNAEPTQKDLWETYLPAFKKLCDAGVESFMGAYNRTLGEPCCGSKYLLKDILRGKWKFQGHVVSDCWAIKDFHENHKVTDTPAESAALALNNGCDLNCGCTYPTLVAAVKSGLVDEATVDQALTRLLRTRFKLGMFDFDEPDPAKRDPAGDSPYRNIGPEVIHSAEHIGLARLAAEKSAVLLKNDANLLPLDDSPKHILIIGPSAANIHVLLGNYFGIGPHLVTILEGITEKVQDKYQISLDYHPGCDQYDYNKNPGWVTGMAKAADVVIATFGLDSSIEGEEGDTICSDSKGDRDYIELPPWQLDFLKDMRTRGTKTVLVLTGGSAVAVPEDIADAILYVWYPGEQGGKAVADLLFGDAVPSGKLPITIPASTDQLPPYDDYSMKGRTYRYMTKEPLYPFGFGLSYTTFSFDSIQLFSSAKNNVLTAKELTEGITAEVTVTNTGSYDADEVIQLYISKKDLTENDPITSLKGFARVAIPVGESRTVSIPLTAESFESIHEDGSATVDAGTYIITAADAAPVACALKKGAAQPVSTEITIKA